VTTLCMAITEQFIPQRATINQRLRLNELAEAVAVSQSKRWMDSDIFLVWV
jgi:hypothetical protein